MSRLTHVHIATSHAGDAVAAGAPPGREIDIFLILGLSLGAAAGILYSLRIMSTVTTKMSLVFVSRIE